MVTPIFGDEGWPLLPGSSIPVLGAVPLAARRFDIGGTGGVCPLVPGCCAIACHPFYGFERGRTSILTLRWEFATSQYVTKVIETLVHELLLEASTKLFIDPVSKILR